MKTAIIVKFQDVGLNRVSAVVYLYEDTTKTAKWANTGVIKRPDSLQAYVEENIETLWLEAATLDTTRYLQAFFWQEMEYFADILTDIRLNEMRGGDVVTQLNAAIAALNQTNDSPVRAKYLEIYNTRIENAKTENPAFGQDKVRWLDAIRLFALEGLTLGQMLKG